MISVGVLFQAGQDLIRQTSLPRGFRPLPVDQPGTSGRAEEEPDGDAEKQPADEGSKAAPPGGRENDRGEHATERR
jgi:hypothetical protein